jgi:hypothetical protein
MRTFGPLPLARATALAGFDQWRHQPEHWNQDARGFRDRLDSRLGAEVLAHTLRFVVARAAREQTGRYRRCSSCETLRERIEYALMTPFRVETPTGVRLSAVTPLTEIGSSLVVTSVHPGGFSFRDGAVGGVSGLASTSLTSLGRELWPWHWRPPGF